MIGHKNLLTACFAALLALGLAACGTTGDDAAPAAMDDTPMDDGMPDPEAELTELEAAQKGAADAATAAGGFATAAETDAATAADAAMGRALFQTTPSSDAHATNAKVHAGLARTAADDAQTAADKAAATTTITVAVRAQGEAEIARDSAETHRGHVTGFHGDAVAVAAMEVFVGEDADGNPTYSVGGTTINAAAGAHTETVNDQKTVTGLMEGMNPMHAGAFVRGVTGAVDDDQTLDVDEAAAPMASVARMDLTIGKTIDSADDTARLMLVTYYTGSKTVNVLAIDPSGDAVVGGANADVTTTTLGRIQIAGATTPEDATDDEFSNLKSVGMYYAVGDDATLEAAPDGDALAEGTMPQEVFSYVSTADDPDTPDTDETVVTYVVLHATRTLTGDDTATYWYRPVGTTVAVDGEQVAVTATLPEVTAYKHINFGVWAGLGEAAKDGKQAIADLGVGFVDSIGDGMTADDHAEQRRCHLQGRLGRNRAGGGWRW